MRKLSCADRAFRRLILVSAGALLLLGSGCAGTAAPESAPSEISAKEASTLFGDPAVADPSEHEAVPTGAQATCSACDPPQTTPAIRVSYEVAHWRDCIPTFNIFLKPTGKAMATFQESEPDSAPCSETWVYEIEQDQMSAGVELPAEFVVQGSDARDGFPNTGSSSAECTVRAGASGTRAVSFFSRYVHTDHTGTERFQLLCREPGIDIDTDSGTAVLDAQVEQDGWQLSPAHHEIGKQTMTVTPDDSEGADGYQAVFASRQLLEVNPSVDFLPCNDSWTIVADIKPAVDENGRLALTNHNNVIVQGGTANDNSHDGGFRLMIFDDVVGGERHWAINAGVSSCSATSPQARKGVRVSAFEHGGQTIGSLLADGNWHRVAGVLDRANRRAAVYLDSALVKETFYDQLGPVEFDAGRWSLTIGNYYGWTEKNFFNGAIRDVRIIRGVPTEFRTFVGYRDEFATADFGGSNGRLEWSSDWIEADPGGDGPRAGQVRAHSGALVFLGTTGSPTRSATRAMDLSQAAATEAVLSFDWRCKGNMEGGNYGQTFSDWLIVEASDDGGLSWSELMALEGNVEMCGGPDVPDQGSRSFRLEDYIALTAGTTDARIRFRTAISFREESVRIDNVDVRY